MDFDSTRTKAILGEVMTHEAAEGQTQIPDSGRLEINLWQGNNLLQYWEEIRDWEMHTQRKSPIEKLR